MNEGDVIVKTMDETAGLGVDPVDTNLNILALGISDYGPTKLRKVSGPTEFKRMYNAGNGITPNDNYTMQYTRALLNSAPIYFKRVTRSNNLLGGVDTLGNDIYVDSKLNPITGSLVNITTNIKSIDTLIGEYHTVGDKQMSLLKRGKDSYVQVNLDTSITWCENYIGTDNSFNDYSNSNGFKDDVLVRTPKSYIYFVPTDTEGGQNPDILPEDIVFTFSVSGEKAITITKSELSTGWKQYVLKRIIQETSIKPDFIIGRGSTCYSVSDIQNIPYDGTHDDFIGFGYFSSVEITSEVNDPAHNIFLVNTDDVSNRCIDEVEVTKIKTESEYENDKDFNNQYIYLPLSNGEKYCFYNGTKPSTLPADTIFEETDSNRISGFFSDFTRYMSNIIDLSTKSENTFIIPNLSTSASVQKSSEILIEIQDPINDSINFSRFGIVSRFPNKSNKLTMSVSLVSESTQTYHIDVSYADIEESWDFSFVEGTVDGYGNDLSFTRINKDIEGSELIKIVELSGDEFNEMSKVTFGAQVTSDYVDSSDMADCLNDIIEYEESPVLFDYIVDSGNSNSNYVSAIKNACDKYFAFYPMSCSIEPDKMGNNDISIRGSLNWEKGNANFISAVQNDNLLDSGIAKFPASLYYLRTRISLASTSFEFQPIFAETNGNIGINNPLVTYKRNRREELLDHQIASLDRNLSNNTYYVNLNQTLKTTDSFLQEDGIALMNMKISQIAYLYGKTLRGLYNTYELRSSINGTGSQLAKSIISRLRVGTQNGPDSINIVCNNTNNPVSLQNQRKIQIDIYARYNRSIKDVLVISHVQSLNE